jgi:hypothetical protein
MVFFPKWCKSEEETSHLAEKSSTEIKHELLNKVIKKREPDGRSLTKIHLFA